MHFICKLSRIMGESHACGSKIVNSRIQTNFSRLTDNSEHGECNCLKTFEKSSEHLRNSSIMLEIGNRWPCFEVVENLSTPSVIFGIRQEIFGNLRKPSVSLWKFRFCEDEKSHAFYWKKVGRYKCMIWNKNLFYQIIKVCSLCTAAPTFFLRGGAAVHRLRVWFKNQNLLYQIINMWFEFNIYYIKSYWLYLVNNEKKKEWQK